MRAVTSRELKQNPNDVYRRVLDSGEPHIITSHGRSVGVKLMPDHPGPRQWVSARELRAALRPLAPENAAELARDLDRLRDDEPIRDPWDDAG